MIRLFFYFSASVGTAFLCSLLEAVLLSVTTTHIALLVKTGHRSGRLLQGVKSNPDRSLAAILTFNTAAQTLGGSLIGAEIQRLFGDARITVISIVFTFFMLFVGEILPKTLAVTRWKSLAQPCAYATRILVAVTYPLVVFLERASRLVTGGKTIMTRMSREEVIVAAELGQSEGTLAEKEARIIRNLLRLNKVFVSDVMTPKEQVFSLWRKQTVADVIEKHGKELYSRVPVFDRDPSDIVGLVLRFDIADASANDQHEMPIEALMTAIHRVRADLSLAKALDELIHRRQHLFLVVNADNKMVGLITLEDAIESLLGVEIEDELDNAEQIRERLMQLIQERHQRPISKRLGTAS